MRIVFFGTGDFACPGLRALVAAGHAVLRVISQPDRPAGRGRKVAPTPVHVEAERLGLPHVQAEDVNALGVDALVAGADLGVVVAFGQKIGGGILGALPRGCVNIHGSLLPKYRGAAPFQWAVINGETTTGVTCFQLNERWDAGPIYDTRSLEIGATETAAELHDRLAELGAGLIVDVVAGMEAGTLTPRMQDASAATRAPKLSKADSVVDWGQPAFRVVRKINGLWSWPTAACAAPLPDGQLLRVQLARAELLDETTTPSGVCPAGTLGEDGVVQAGLGRLRLLEVKPAGGKLMRFSEFARGRRLQPPVLLRPADEA